MTSIIIFISLLELFSRLQFDINEQNILISIQHKFKQKEHVILQAAGQEHSKQIRPHAEDPKDYVGVRHVLSKQTEWGVKWEMTLKRQRLIRSQTGI